MKQLSQNGPILQSAASVSKLAFIAASSNYLEIELNYSEQVVIVLKSA
jgi:hypothetical protein